MIRPLTIATCLLACGSGLYLYQEKHEVQLLDRTIERTVHDTAALREQSRLLAAEWTMLNDPERLRQFSDTYLHLKTITPTQFTSLADLDGRLPPPQAETPAHEEQELVPVASETLPPGAADPAADPGTATAAPAAVVQEDLPVPPIPVTPPSSTAVASTAHPADVRIPDRLAVVRPSVADSPTHPVATGQPRLADQRSTEQHPPSQSASDQHPTEQRGGSRVADARTAVGPPPPQPIVLASRRPLLSTAPVASTPSRPAVVATQSPPSVATPNPSTAAVVRPAIAAEPTPYSGSLLGMARGSMPPAPRPTPVTYNAN
jgi:hypothetical protein